MVVLGRPADGVGDGGADVVRPVEVRLHLGEGDRAVMVLVERGEDGPQRRVGRHGPHAHHGHTALERAERDAVVAVGVGGGEELPQRAVALAQCRNELRLLVAHRARAQQLLLPLRPLLALPDVYEFIVRPEQTWIITENGPNIARIYTDGRKHPPPDELWPTFTGDSVGYWEGQTLVFTTVSMIGDERTILDRSGLTLSDQASIETRMFLTDEGLLRAELTIDDPLALTKTWHVTRHFRKLEEGTRVYDYACAENNRNPITEAGQTLTLDTEGNVIDIEIDAAPEN